MALFEPGELGCRANLIHVATHAPALTTFAALQIGGFSANTFDILLAFHALAWILAGLAAALMFLRVSPVRGGESPKKKTRLAPLAVPPMRIMMQTKSKIAICMPDILYYSINKN